MKKPSEKAALKAAVRELICAVDILRFACEHAEGKRKADGDMLAKGMSFGLRILEEKKGLIGDYQMPTYNADSAALWARIMTLKSGGQQMNCMSCGTELPAVAGRCMCPGCGKLRIVGTVDPKARRIISQVEDLARMLTSIVGRHGGEWRLDGCPAARVSKQPFDSSGVG
jgi:predicted RNA-binding Zn-ribbon protein involved in translation (DUF1610 family)